MTKQMQEVNKKRGPASEKVDNNTNTVGLENVVPPVPARKIKVPTTILRPAGDGRFKTRVITPGRMQGPDDTDCGIVDAKNKSDRSQNDALNQDVKSTQHDGKQ